MKITSINIRDIKRFSKSPGHNVIRKPLAYPRNSQQLIRPRKLEGVFILKKDLNLCSLLKKAYLKQQVDQQVETDPPFDHLTRSPMTVKHIGLNNQCQSYQYSSPFMRTSVNSPEEVSRRKNKIKIKELSPDNYPKSAFPQLTVYSSRNPGTIERPLTTQKSSPRVKKIDIALQSNCRPPSFKRSKIKLKSLTQKDFKHILKPW
jgi:hypothetical protein